MIILIVVVVTSIFVAMAVAPFCSAWVRKEEELAKKAGR